MIGFALITAVAGNAQSWANNEEAPAHLLAVWVSLGLLAVILITVSLAIRHHRRRGLKAILVLPDDPFAVEALQAGVELFCRLEPAFTQRAASRLERLLTPTLWATWSHRLEARATGGLVVDGPVRFSYVGAADPPEHAERRAVLHVEGRLRPPSRQVALSRGQRNGLLSLAAAILIAAFVGIALAPATKIRSARPTTIVVRDGVPLGGTHLLAYRRGGLIDLTVRSDVADEVHFHGYDIHRDVAPGHPVHFLIRATIEGSYPVELEQHNETLAQVSVQP